MEGRGSWLLVIGIKYDAMYNDNGNSQFKLFSPKYSFAYLREKKKKKRQLTPPPSSLKTFSIVYDFKRKNESWLLRFSLYISLSY